MQILVQKFGGTSVQSKQNRERVVKHVKNALANNFKLIVVVSALGRKPDPYATDTLLELVDYPAHFNSRREIDLLLSCGETIASILLSNELKKHHIRATALTGAQAGFITNTEFNQAQIKEINVNRIHKELLHNDVIVVAGFQGQTDTGEITTIGRGGSDTSAAALGVALNAQYIDIYTDVNGIMTADPRIVKNAQSLKVVTYTEICNMAYQGAKVVHPRAVEIAMQAKTPMRIRSTYSNQLGTLVTTSNQKETGMKIPDRLLTGIAHISGVSQIKVPMNGDVPYQQSDVFKAMAEADISVDFINISPSGVIYTVPTSVTKKVKDILIKLGFLPIIYERCAKVSTVGAGMKGMPGVASRIVQALTNTGVDILQSADSHTTIWVLIQESDLKVAVNALHDVFELGKKTKSLV